MDDHTTSINKRSSHLAINNCDQLKFQWHPRGVDFGSLIISKGVKVEHVVST